jgi:hypothetical protein
VNEHAANSKHENARLRLRLGRLGGAGSGGPALSSIAQYEPKGKICALQVWSRIVRPARHDSVVKQGCLHADAGRRIDIEDPVHSMGCVRCEPSRGKEEGIVNEALCTRIMVGRLDTSKGERDVGLRLRLVDAENINRGA